MKKTIITLGLVTLMLLGVSYIYAQGRDFGPEHKGGPRWESSSTPDRGPALTPEQKTKFQELRQKFNEETAQLRGNILTKRLELQSLWTNPKADPKAIADKERELRDLQNQVKDKMVQLKLEARKLLTLEQISNFGQGWMRGTGSGRGPMMSHNPGMGYGYCR